jgi:hypothetical protein
MLRRDDSKAIRLSHIYVHLHTLTDKSILYISTEKKVNKIFHIYKEIQSGAVAKSYMRKGLLIYEEIPQAADPLPPFATCSEDR